MPDLSSGLRSILDPVIRRVLQRHEDAINHVAEQSNVAPVGILPSPAPHAKIEVTGGGGYTDVRLTDNSDQFRGKEHFLDYSNDGGNNWHTKYLGPSLNYHGILAGGNLIVRSWNRYGASPPSPFLYHPVVNVTAGVEPPMSKGTPVVTLPYSSTSIPKR